MNAVLQKDILNECYTDMAVALDKLCWRFRGRYGGDFDELRAEANLQFIYAHNKFDNTSSYSYEWWVTFRVWKCLLERVRDRARKNTRHKDMGMVNEEMLPHRFDETRNVDFMDLLSENAQDVANLILDTPNALKDLYTLYTGIDREDPEVERLAEQQAASLHKQIHNKGGNCRANVPCAIRSFLQHKIGWTISQVKEAFMEIEVAVNG